MKKFSKINKKYLGILKFPIKNILGNLYNKLEWNKIS